jgi:hypothetical protein
VTIRTNHLTDFSVLLGGLDNGNGIDWLWTIMTMAFGGTALCLVVVIGTVLTCKPQWQEKLLGWTGPSESDRRARRVARRRQETELQALSNSSLPPPDLDSYYAT